jgi:hypothetical protein
MSSGKAYSVSNPPSVAAVNPDTGVSREFVLSIGTSRFAAGDAGYAPAVPDQTGSQVQVDNSQGNHASSGTVINPSPSSARIGVHNLHQFWTNVTLHAPGNCCVHLGPSFNGGDIGGLYAKFGAIAPDGDATWEGSFDPGTAQPIITTPSIAGGSYIAGTLNILTVVAGLASKFPTANSIETVVSAVETAQKATDLIAALQAMEKADVPAFVQHVYDMLSDPNQRALIRTALQALAVPVSEGFLEKLTLVVLIVELGQMAFDEASALVQGTWAGVVNFSASYPPVTQPPVTQPPVTQPPVTQPLVTQPPVTQPPVTQPPVTQPPVTQPPVTQPPVTQPPVTQPPVQIPNAPSNVRIVTVECVTFPCPPGILKWEDNSTNESGFYTYSSSPECGLGRVGQVPMNTTDWFLPDASVCLGTYGVSAFNAAGESAIAWAQ